VIAKRIVLSCLVWTVAAGSWTLGGAAQEPVGERLYVANCQRCHGTEGRGGQGPTLVPFTWTHDEARDRIRHPLCDMPPFRESDLSDADIREIVDYLKSIK